MQTKNKVSNNLLSHNHLPLDMKLQCYIYHRWTNVGSTPTAHLYTGLREQLKNENINKFLRY